MFEAGLNICRFNLLNHRRWVLSTKASDRGKMCGWKALEAKAKEWGRGKWLKYRKREKKAQWRWGVNFGSAPAQVETDRVNSSIPTLFSFSGGLKDSPVELYWHLHFKHSRHTHTHTQVNVQQHTFWSHFLEFQPERLLRTFLKLKILSIQKCHVLSLSLALSFYLLSQPCIMVLVLLFNQQV